MNGIIIYAIVFLYGIVIGSFLNVCIYRIPEGTSVVTERSHCMKCNRQLKWFELIPVFSYLFLGGRCRTCKTRISIQYPMIEALNGILYVLVFYLYGWNSFGEIFLSIAYCLIMSALIVLSVIDLRTNIIPFGINIFILVIGLVIVLVKYFYFEKSMKLVLEHIIGFFAISFLLFLLFYLSRGRAIGGGDVKLMAAAGFVLGWQNVLLAFFLGCILASIIHPIRMKLSNANSVLAFGPYLSAGIAIAILYGQNLIHWYIDTFILI
ncbi:MAG TPA: prepilin peptidase [Clostridiales bacterium]|nr:prepilin peptidase [Clostridiales bacterium]